MAHRGPEDTSRLPHAQTELVENILGVPLLLPDKSTNIPAHRLPASEAAYFMMLEMVQRHVGQDLSALNKPARLPDADMAELAVLPDVAFLAREVRVATNFTRNLRQPLALPEYADKPDTARSRLQSKLLGNIAAHYQTLPAGLNYDPDNPLGVRLQDGFALIAKTGIGKTIVAALMMRLAGLTDILVPEDEALTGTIVTSSVKLVKQFAGESGNKTFLRFLGDDVDVTKVMGNHFDPSGRVRITTTRSIFKFDPGQVLVIDEGHHALEEQLAGYLGRSSLRPLLLTATPAYSQHRDLRNLWSSCESPSTRTLIEDGILNPTRLLTVEYDDDPVPAVVAAALKHIEMGQKVGIYCLPGGESAQARQIADLINKAVGKRVIESVGSHQPRSDQFEQEFDDGTLRALSTCRRLGEGWDATDADVGMFIDPRAAWRLEQNGGRFMRPGKFVTELYEFFKRGVPRKTSLWKIMGLEKAEPGKIIGYREPSEDDEQQNRTASGNIRPQPDVMPLEDLPPIVLDNLLIDVPLRRVLLGREDVQPSEGFTRKLRTLAETHNVPAKWLQSKLDEQGFRYEGIREVDPNTNEITYDRWYEGDPVDAWITENPLPELASKDEMTARAMADILETTPHHIAAVLSELGLEPIPEPRLTPSSHQKRPHYSFEAFCAVTEKVEKDTPLAEETDVVAGALYAECGTQFVAGCINKMSAEQKRDDILRDKRRNPIHGIKGLALHISQADADAIREERRIYDAIPVADPNTYTPLTAAANRAQLSLSIFEKRLTEEEQEAVISLRKAPKAHPGRFIPNDVLDRAIERLKPQKLGAHLVPVRIYSKHFAVQKEKRIMAWIAEQFGEPQEYRLEGSIRDTPCITWDQLRQAEEKFGKRPSALAIDYTKLVRGPEDTDPERWQYTQSVQRHYLGDTPSHPLAPLPDHITESELVPKAPIPHDLDSKTESSPVQTQPEPPKPSEPPAPPVVPTLVFSEPQYERPITTTPEPSPLPKQELLPVEKPASTPEPAAPEPAAKPSVPLTPARPRLAFVAAEKSGEAPETVLSAQQFTVDPSRARRPKGPEPPKTPEKRESAPSPTPPPVHTLPQGPASGTPTPTAKPAVPPSPPVQSAAMATPTAPKQTTPRGTIPAHFVDAHETLGPICSGPALSMLLRRERVQARIEQEGSKRIYWIDPDDAEILKLTIESVPVAPPDYKTAAAIAESYRKQIPHLAPHHIQNLVGKLVSDATPYMSLRRERLPDGKPGKFDFHYNDILSGKIEGAIEEAIRRGRIPSLIRNSLR